MVAIEKQITNKERLWNMNFDNFTNVTSSQERDLMKCHVLFPSLMRKVYVWMAMALAITGVIAYGAGNSPALIQLLYMGRGPLLVAGLVEVGIVWYLSSRTIDCHSLLQQYGSLPLQLSTD